MFLGGWPSILRIMPHLLELYIIDTIVTVRELARKRQTS